MEPAARFLGLNNVTDPMRLGLEWLVQADNVDVTDTGALEKRVGTELALAGSPTSAYATLDEQRMYVVDGTTLKAMAGPDSTVSLRTGLDRAVMQWAEVNEQVFFTNGVDSGIVNPDNSLMDWAWPVPPTPAVLAVAGTLAAGLYQVRVTYTLADGRMTGPSESAEITLAGDQALQISGIPQRTGCTTNVYIAPANSSVYGLAARSAPAAMLWNAGPDNLGAELRTIGTSPLPAGCDVITEWKGRIFAGQYFPELKASAVWSSKPLGFHLFDLKKDVFMVPGRILMLAPHQTAVIVGTDLAIRAYNSEGLAPLAPYGVLPGQHWSEDPDDKSVVFWSTRGICRALPFANLTEQNYSPAPGVAAGGAIVLRNGQKRYLASLQVGGSSHNARDT